MTSSSSSSSWAGGVPLLNAANVQNFAQSIVTPRAYFPAIAVPAGAKLKMGIRIDPHWVRIRSKGDGLTFALDELESFQTTDGSRRKRTAPRARTWKQLVEAELCSRYKLRDSSRIYLLRYADLVSEMARDDRTVVELEFDGKHERWWNGWKAAARDVTDEFVWDTFHLRGYETLKHCSQGSERWFLLVDRLKQKLNRGTVFKQFNDEVPSDQGSDGGGADNEGDEASGAEDSDDEDAVGERLVAAIASAKLSKAQLDHLRAHLNQDSERPFLINGGVVREEGSHPNWNSLPRDVFYSDAQEELRNAVIQPCVQQLDILRLKAQAVGKLTPSFSAAAAALPANKAARHSNATFFLVSPEFAVTCFHCLFSPKLTVDTRSGRVCYRWHPISMSWTLLLPSTGKSCKINLDTRDIAYSSPPMTDNWYVFREDPDGDGWVESPNIGYDLVIFRVPRALSSALSPHAYIRFQPSAKDGSEACLLQPDGLNHMLLQSLYVIGFPGKAHQPVDASGQPRVCITARNNLILSLFHWELLYSCPTWAGMSGGPGLLADGTLVSMHRRAGPQINHAKPHEGHQLLSAVNMGLRIDLFFLDEAPSRYKKNAPLQTVLTSLQTFYATVDTSRGPPASIVVPTNQQLSLSNSSSSSSSRGNSASSSAAPSARSHSPLRTLTQIADLLRRDSSVAAYLAQPPR